MRICIFFALVGVVLVGCAASKQIYEGPEQPQDQIARIKLDTKPYAISGKKTEWLDWPPFSDSFTVDVLPGHYKFSFEHISKSQYVEITYRWGYAIKVEAGHTYRIYCDRWKRKCSKSDTTGHEEY